MRCQNCDSSELEIYGQSSFAGSSLSIKGTSKDGVFEGRVSTFQKPNITIASIKCKSCGKEIENKTLAKSIFIRAINELFSNKVTFLIDEKITTVS